MTETVEVELWLKHGVNVVSMLSYTDIRRLKEDIFNKSKGFFECTDEEGVLMFALSDLIMLSIHNDITGETKVGF